MTKHRVDLLLEPLDTLFFRDARPMQAGAGSGGHGARWPLPMTLHSALRTALLTDDGSLPRRKAVMVRRVRKDREVTSTVGDTRFDHVRLQGGLPWWEGRPYFPVPADLAPAKKSDKESPAGILLRPLQQGLGITNFPAPWLHPVGAYIPATKEKLPSWVDGDFLQTYLGSPGSEELTPPDFSEPWTVEHRYGIQINAETRTVVERAFYVAEHLRLKQGAGIWVALECNASDEEAKDALNRLAAGGALTVGGEGRACRTKQMPDVPVPEPVIRGNRVKWVLSSPAVFDGGWRPGWVDRADGKVKLKRNLERNPGETRLAWRERMKTAPEIGARLVAVCAGKPFAFSGWEVLGGTAAEGRAGNGSGAGTPRSTQLAVPAGSVYYFEADNEADARILAEALHGRCHSDRLGEKGFGWGFCGTWDWLEPFWGSGGTE
jgi:CRISPR type III-B/RAMP module-associated protein Cmr3